MFHSAVVKAHESSVLLKRIALAFIWEKAFNMQILNEQIVLHPLSLFHVLWLKECRLSNTDDNHWCSTYATLRAGDTKHKLKGQCHFFASGFFHESVSPKPLYTIRAILNFFKNSRRYSQLKVHHRCRENRWQMEKIFNQKNFHYFFWHIWIVELAYR